MNTEDTDAVGADADLVYRMEGLVEGLVLLREDVMDGPLSEMSRDHVRAGMALLGILANNLIEDVTQEEDAQSDPEVLAWDVQVIRVWHILDLVNLRPGIVSKLASLTELDVQRLVDVQKLEPAEIERVVEDLIELGVGPLRRLHSRAIIEAVALGAET